MIHYCIFLSLHHPSSGFQLDFTLARKRIRISFVKGSDRVGIGKPIPTLYQPYLNPIPTLSILRPKTGRTQTKIKQKSNVGNDRLINILIHLLQPPCLFYLFALLIGCHHVFWIILHKKSIYFHSLHSGNFFTLSDWLFFGYQPSIFNTKEWYYHIKTYNLFKDEATHAGTFS